MIQSDYGQVIHLIDGIRAFVTVADMGRYIIKLGSFIYHQLFWKNQD